MRQRTSRLSESSSTKPRPPTSYGATEADHNVRNTQNDSKRSMPYRANVAKDGAFRSVLDAAQTLERLAWVGSRDPLLPGALAGYDTVRLLHVMRTKRSQSGLFCLLEGRLRLGFGFALLREAEKGGVDRRLPRGKAGTRDE